MGAVERLTIILPAKNESDSLSRLLPALAETFPDARLLVVDDGSDDDTADVAAELGATVVRHRRSLGNGAAIKSGVRAAEDGLLLFMDADGQHTPEAAGKLLERFAEDIHMCVGARNWRDQASVGRLLANAIYNRFARYIAGQPVSDLTSGLRLARRSEFIRFLDLLPNGFSYPSTISLAYFRTGFLVEYVPVKVEQRNGDSHIRPIRDGIRFLTILFKLTTLYSPLKLFAPLSVAFFGTGTLYYLYTYLTVHRFTNMSLLWMVTGILIFLIGLVAEQITTLIYRDTGGQR